MYREFEEYVFNNYDMNMKGINRKYYHSKRVAILSKKLAENLALRTHDVKLATQIGLLHDIARFYEYALFNNFEHKQNFDHGEYGVKFLKEDNNISKYGIIKEDYETVYYAVFYHNKYKLPRKLKNNIFCKIIRDADKIDIFYIISRHKDFIYSNNDLRITPKVLADFNKNKPIKSKDIKTLGDKILSVLAYIYDINYDYSLKIIKENKYLDLIYDNLENKEIFKGYFNRINTYIEKRLKNVRN